MEFIVSVIIPVYNHGKFVENAVKSALNQREVGEVILIEDGSTDHSLDVCYQIAFNNVKVKLFRHDAGKNLGAAASRNLGILKSRFNFISFLDADDIYLNNRFEIDKSIFLADPSVNVVYNLSKINFDDSLVNFGYQFDILKESKKMGYSNPYDFILDFDITLADTNSLTFRIDCFNNIKLFDQRLGLHQDTELWLRIFRENKIKAGQIKHPVSLTTRHKDNRIIKESIFTKIKLLFVWVDNLGFKNLYKSEKKFIIYVVSKNISNIFSIFVFRKVTFRFIYFLLTPIRSVFIFLFYKSFLLLCKT